MDVSVIIVNYNTCKLLDKCLESIKKTTQDVTYEIIVVDNDSHDDSREMIKTKYPWVKLIESENNLGFGRANNLGFEHSKGRYIFLLNSDTILIENSIKILSNTLDANTSIGAVGATLVDGNNQQVHSYGIFPSVFRKLFKRRFVIKGVDFKEDQNVDYITGADLMIPRAVWLQLDGFDPHFFMYYEETDLQKRMALLGYKRVIVPSTKIIHLEGGSSINKTTSTTGSEWKKITMFKSMMYYMKKHSSWIEFFLLKFILKAKYKYLAKTNLNKSVYYNNLLNCIK